MTPDQLPALKTELTTDPLNLGLTTEIKALSMFFLGAASLEGGTSYLKNVFGKSGK